MTKNPQRVILSAAKNPDAAAPPGLLEPLPPKWAAKMNWTARRRLIFLSGFTVFMLDLLLYAAALVRTPHIDPTSIEWCLYFFGGIAMNAVFLVLACFGSGWKRVTILLSGLCLAYCWISYIGIEVMKH